MLPALAKAGLKFETIDQRKWVQLLRDGAQDPKLNPTTQLLSFYVDRYDKLGHGELIFGTTETAKKSNAIEDGYDVLDSRHRIARQVCGTLEERLEPRSRANTESATTVTLKIL